MAPVFDFEAAEALLCTAEFTRAEPVWRSSNYVYLCTLAARDGTEVLAIYKPRRGESPLWDFPAGTLYRREIAAYRLARLLGWPMVPPTVEREGPQGAGSLQLFVEHNPQEHFFVLRENAELLPQLKRMAAFDAVANNADRKGGHCLLDPEGAIWGIDHGVCFHEEMKLRTVIWDWADEPLPPEWLADVESAMRCIEAGDRAALPLLALLSGQEVRAMLSRARNLVASACLPRPGPYRPYPWPLI
jgi:uncharacterized repeat protein (TIGR03843 family)